MSHRHKKPAPISKQKAAQLPLEIGVAPPSLSMDRFHKIVASLGKEAGNAEELKEKLERLRLSGELDRMLNDEPDDPRERAMDLVERALRTPQTAAARKLLKQALALDPDCVDAMMGLARCEKLSDDEYATRMREVVDAARRVLGERTFEEDRGHFWGLVETRPYMRARMELGMALVMAGQLTEAAHEFEEMLRLNPNDNQGVREYLLSTYLAAEDLAGVRRLFKQYDDDDSAVFAWGKVFFQVLAGDRAKARGVMREALACNPWVLLYLSGKKASMPAMYSPGRDDEAQFASVVLGPAQMAHPDVVVWMAKEFQHWGQEMATKRKPS